MLLQVQDLNTYYGMSKVAMSLANRVYLMGKAHIGFAGTIAELEAHPDARARYLEV